MTVCEDQQRHPFVADCDNYTVSCLHISLAHEHLTVYSSLRCSYASKSTNSYQAQVSYLSNALRPSFGQELEIGSVDGMQGREKEAVILSLVRSNEEVRFSQVT